MSATRKAVAAETPAGTRRPSRRNVLKLYTEWDERTAADRIIGGIPTFVLSEIQERLDLTNRELADAILVAPRTLARRRHEDRLPPDESERVYRLARLIHLASSIFGDRHEAREWLKEPNLALGESTPLEMARTQPGATLVERVLHQIEFGLTV